VVNGSVDVLWNETSEDHWQAQMTLAGAPFQQSWTYGEVAGACGALVHRFEFRIHGKTIALAQGIERWFLRPVVLFSMGPVWIGKVSNDQRAWIIRHLKKTLGGFLVSTPPDATSREAFEHARLKDVMTPSTLAYLTLGPGLRKRMHVKWRNRLTTAEGNGITIRPSQSLTRQEWLLNADRQQQKQRHYRALPPAFTRAWSELDPKSVTLLTAQTKAEPIAAMLFLRHGATVSYHIGWTGPEGRAASAHNLILAHAAEHFATKGVSCMNLGLLDTETAPGLARFKLGSGAQPVETGGTWLGW
jgi:hypothetical protein